MVTKEKARQIGINACEEAIGKAFANKHKKTSSVSHGYTPDGYFVYLGIDTKPEEPMKKLVLTSTGFPYYAQCFVDMKTGDVTMGKCVVPK